MRTAGPLPFEAYYRTLAHKYLPDSEDRVAVLDDIFLSADFINQTVNYFETENYIFVHGWLPYRHLENGFEILPDWRNTPPQKWVEARWTKWTEMYTKCNRLEKTIVCGHMPTFYANQFDENRTFDDSEIFKSDKLIALDGGTFTSKKVNVLVLNENLI